MCAEIPTGTTTCDQSGGRVRESCVFSENFSSNAIYTETEKEIVRIRNRGKPGVRHEPERLVYHINIGYRC